MRIVFVFSQLVLSINPLVFGLFYSVTSLLLDDSHAGFVTPADFPCNDNFLQI